MEIKEQKITNLVPRSKGPRILGRVHYNESAQAWNIIRLKKQILEKFPQLKSKQGSFCYKMNMYENFKELEDDIKEMKKNGDVVPMVMMLAKGEK